jgi:hypothetical protein
VLTSFLSQNVVSQNGGQARTLFCFWFCRLMRTCIWHWHVLCKILLDNVSKCQEKIPWLNSKWLLAMWRHIKHVKKFRHKLKNAYCTHSISIITMFYSHPIYIFNRHWECKQVYNY